RLGALGDDIGERVADLVACPAVLAVTDRRAEPDIADEKLRFAARRIDVIGKARAVDDREAGEIGKRFEDGLDLADDALLDPAQQRAVVPILGVEHGRLSSFARPRQPQGTGHSLIWPRLSAAPAPVGNARRAIAD